MWSYQSQWLMEEMHLFFNFYLKTLRKFTVNRCLGWETASSHPSYKWVEQYCSLPQGVTAGQSSMLFLPIGRKLFGIWRCPFFLCWMHDQRYGTHWFLCRGPSFSDYSDPDEKHRGHHSNEVLGRLKCLSAMEHRMR